jgi:HEAT repeats
MNEFEDIDKKLWEALEKIETPSPSNEMKPRFYAMLDTYKREQEAKKEGFVPRITSLIKSIFTAKPSVNWAYSIVFAMACGIGGYFIGKPNRNEVERLSSEVQEMKQMMMLTMLEDPTATERMKAVSYTQDLKTVDDQVIEALLTTLNSDPNENVRLVTLEALVELGHHPKVREGLVHSLMKQESPLVQVALADAMVKLQEKSSINGFKKLLQKPNLNKAVKAKIEKSMKEIV